ncbi:amidase [Thermocatellispora tengchongensis]|uniref:Amidase n=1 Tax=Thermocatellispora tengchongensis TaxID=1073253 RepID=A0A840P1Y5_9ACTN|nr:amidase family protein [Thermocatellispora tengchongensis]MBB5131943.1 amidase [Thermocatellispora tengchongensis]
MTEAHLPQVEPFVPWGAPPPAPGRAGPLSGLRLTVKDVIDVAGLPTGAGHPRWLDTHPVPARDADAVAALREAGAELVGKSHTDELAFSLGGTNAHYGAPANPAAPGHACGGSSSGTAAAVASGAADLGLGTDTAGSIRVPAAYTGLWGFRPSHARVSRAGLVPLAPSFDVPGLLARDVAVLRLAAAFLLGGGAGAEPATRLHVPPDLWSAVSPRVGAALAPALRRLAESLPIDRTPVFPGPGLDGERVRAAFAVVQGAQAWDAHGVWITTEHPEFGPGVGARFRAAARITKEELAPAEDLLARAAERIAALLADGGLLALPTAPTPAPPLPEGFRSPGSDGPGGGREAEEEPAPPTYRGHSGYRAVVTGPRDRERRAATVRLTCLAGLAGAPAVSLPAGRLDGLPLGLSLMAAPGHDERVLETAAALA